MSIAIQDFGLLRNLQDEVVLFLQTDEQLSGPPMIYVHKDDDGDIQAKIKKLIGPVGNGGGMIVVSCPDPAEVDKRRECIFPVTILIQCLESPIINRSKNGNNVRAKRLGEIVFNKLWKWSSANGWTPFSIIERKSGLTEEKLLGDRIIFGTSTMYSVEIVGD